MSLLVVILIFSSACFHMSWNYMNKEGIKDVISWIYIFSIKIIIFSPFLFFYYKHIPFLFKFLPLMLLSFSFSAMQTWALNTAYRYGEYTVIYPVKNSLPIVFTALMTYILHLGVKVTYIGYIGYFFIILGCILFPIANFKNISLKTYFNLSLIFTIIAAIGSCVYSICDKEVLNGALELSPDISPIGLSLLYNVFLHIFLTIFLIPFVFIDKYVFKIDYKKIKFNTKKIITIAILSTVPYTLVLIALTYATNAGYVVAFRQIGIPLSLVVGAIFLKEKIYLGKILGALSIVIGLVILAFCK